MSSFKKILSQSLEKTWFHPLDFKLALGYSCGLLLAPKKPTLKLLQATTGFKALDYSAFLQADLLGWPTETLFDSLIETLPDGGELLTDVVVAPKENTSKMDADMVYSSCDKRVLQGQAYAVLAWSKGERVQIVGFRVIDKELFAMTEEMIDHFLTFGISITGISADGAYFKAEFRKSMKQRGLGLITKPRRDSKWFLNSDFIQLKEWAAQLKVESFHYYSEQKVYARSFIMSRHDTLPCIIVVIRPKRSCKAKDILFLVSTELGLTTRQVIVGYRRRWRIEVTFRDCSQNLGLKSHQGYSQTSERHVAMVFLTYNILADLKVKSEKTLGWLVRKLQHLSSQERTRDSAVYDKKIQAITDWILSR